jgi:hypothetical protein
VERSDGEQPRRGVTLDPIHFISSISPHLSGMTSIHLDIAHDRKEDTTKPEYESILSRFLRRSFTLKQLILDLYYFDDLNTQLHLPYLPALEELYLRIWLGKGQEGTEFFSELDSALPRILRRVLIPSLRTLTVIGNNDNPSADEEEKTAAHELLRNRFDQTKEFCTTAGLRFAYSERDFSMFTLSLQ